MINSSTKKISLSLTLVAAIFITFSANAKDDVKKGAEIYGGTCVACHGTKGKGEFPGMPDLTSSKSPLTKSDEILFDHILNGFQSGNSAIEMPALGAYPELTDQEIKDVIAYMRKTFQ
jgi:mono/diheme cytochrome c family protein